jgi:hypothetical protein
MRLVAPQWKNDRATARVLAPVARRDPAVAQAGAGHGRRASVQLRLIVGGAGRGGRARG